MEKLQNIINTYLEKHFRAHFHLSLKYLSGTTMIIVSLGLGIFMIDSSIFSASLIQNRILTEATSLTQSSQESAGILPSSPLYPVFSFFSDHQKPSIEGVFIIFSKLIKASQGASSRDAQILSQIFDQKIKQLSITDQQVLLQKLSTKLADTEITNNAFPYAFDVYARLGNEKFWTQKLMAYVNQGGEQTVIYSRAKTIFMNLAAKTNWESNIINHDLVSDLSFIKSSIQIPQTSEVLHATADKELEENVIWKAL